MKNHYIIPIFVPHEGCPHGCVFCNQRDITGQHEKIDGQDVAAIIQSYLSSIPSSQNRFIEVGFFGGSFTGIPLEKQKELLLPALEAKQKGHIQGIRLSTRPDYIDHNILDHLLEFQVDIIEIGVQSMAEQVLMASGRGHTIEEVRLASDLIKKRGMALGIQLMVGLPLDSYEQWLKSVRESIGLAPDLVRIYPTLVLRGTELEEMMKEGKYHPLSLNKAVLWSRDALALFRLAGIQVIRIGLQPTEEISPQAKVTAGPYHPAFRQLVESSLMLCLLEEAISDLVKTTDIDQEILIRIPVQKESYFRGQKNQNLQTLARLYPDFSVKMKMDPHLCNDEFLLECRQSRRLFSSEELLRKWVEGRQQHGSVIQ